MEQKSDFLLRKIFNKNKLLIEIPVSFKLRALFKF